MCCSLLFGTRKQFLRHPQNRAPSSFPVYGSIRGTGLVEDIVSRSEALFSISAQVSYFGLRWASSRHRRSPLISVNNNQLAVPDSYRLSISTCSTLPLTSHLNSSTRFDKNLPFKHPKTKQVIFEIWYQVSALICLIYVEVIQDFYPKTFVLFPLTPSPIVKANGSSIKTLHSRLSLSPSSEFQKWSNTQKKRNWVYKSSNPSTKIPQTFDPTPALQQLDSTRNSCTPNATNSHSYPPQSPRAPY